MMISRRKILLSVPTMLGAGIVLSACSSLTDKKNPDGTEKGGVVVQPFTTTQEIDGIVYEMTQHSLKIGNSDIAENTVRIYEDLQCPYCRDLKAEISDDLRRLIEEDKLVAEFVVVNYLGVRSTNAWSENTANLLAVVASHQPDKFMDVQKVLYDNQPDKRNTDPFTGEQLREMVDGVIEFSEEEIDQIDNGYFVNWVNEQVNPFAAKNEINSIPTVEWNNVKLDDYSTIIDELAKL